MKNKIMPEYIHAAICCDDVSRSQHIQTITQKINLHHDQHESFQFKALILGYKTSDWRKNTDI